MNRYKPGQAVRFSLQSFELGVLTDPPTPVLTVADPTGATTTGTVVHDGTGLFHSDVLIPFTGVGGIWSYRWRSTGGLVDQNAIAEVRFRVDPLNF